MTRTSTATASMPAPQTSDTAPPTAPSPHRSALVVFAIIFPLVHVIPPLVTQTIDGPRVVNEAIAVAIIVSLMTYVLMPLAKRLLGSWLLGPSR